MLNCTLFIYLTCCTSHHGNCNTIFFLLMFICTCTFTCTFLSCTLFFTCSAVQLVMLNRTVFVWLELTLKRKTWIKFYLNFLKTQVSFISGWNLAQAFNYSSTRSLMFILPESAFYFSDFCPNKVNPPVKLFLQIQVH